MRIIVNFFVGCMSLAEIVVAQNIDFTKGTKLNSIAIKHQHSDDPAHFYSAHKKTPLILTNWRRDAISNSRLAPVQFAPQQLTVKVDPPKYLLDSVVAMSLSIIARSSFRYAFSWAVAFFSTYCIKPLQLFLSFSRTLKFFAP